MANSKDSNKHIAKLNNDNYYAWSYRMEMRLRKLQVWSLVEGKEDRPLGSDGSKKVMAWRVRTDLALSEIVSEVEDGQLVHTRTSRNPAEVWAKLEAVHRHLSQGLGSVISTWQRLFQIKKAPHTSIQEHAGTIQQLADRLTGLNDAPSDSLLVAILMLSLPPSYSSLVISLDSHSSRNDFNFVVLRCINEEARQATVQAAQPTDKQGVPASSDDPRNEAYAVDTKNLRDRRQHVTCFKCGKKGHYRNECTASTEEAASASMAEDLALIVREPVVPKRQEIVQVDSVW